MNIEPDELHTRAFSTYAYEVTRIVGFFDALNRLTRAAEQAAPVLSAVVRPMLFSDALPGSSRTPEQEALRTHLESSDSEFTLEERRGALHAAMWLTMSSSALDDNRNFLLQATYCRLADNFLAFLGDLLGTIYTSNPNTLLHDDIKVPLSEILQHADIDSIVSEVASRRVFGLGYKGVVDLNATIRTKLHFSLIAPAFEADVERAIRTRNVLVHARGRVRKEDGAYFGVSTGDRLIPNAEEVFAASRVLNQCARSADRRALEKFGLPGEPVTPFEWDFDDRDREVRESGATS